MHLFQVSLEELRPRLKVADDFWLTWGEKKGMCNGCGTGITAYIIPNTVYGLNIRIACCIHDYGYEVGGTEEDRQKLDDELHDNIEAIIDSFDTWYYPTRPAKLRADTYRFAVEKAGAGAFNYKKDLT